MGGFFRPEVKRAEWHPTDIGPSLLSIEVDPDLDTTVYRVMLWVGGTRFDEHGEGSWGKNITMTFQIPNHQRGWDIELGITATMQPHRKHLVDLFGETASEAIMKAIPAIAGGYVFKRAMRPEEVIEGVLR